MTEEESKTKWCPFARNLGTLTKLESEEIISMGSQNRGYQMGGPLFNCMCIGSACMAWRKLPPGTQISENTWTISDYHYCGLAGKP